MQTMKIQDKKNLLKIAEAIGFEQFHYFDEQYRKCPIWFELYVKHYDRKDEILDLLDAFGIVYPDYLKTLRMPYQYTEEELDLIFEKGVPLGVPNGCTFRENMNFWFEYHDPYHFDIKRVLEGQGFSKAVPWQLFLRHPLLVEEKYFAQIADYFERNSWHLRYFAQLPRYQKLTKEQYDRLAPHVKRFSYDYEDFFYEGMQAGSHKVADVFLETAGNFLLDYRFDFMPGEHQARFIKSLSDKARKFEFIKQSKLSKEEKLALI